MLGIARVSMLDRLGPRLAAIAELVLPGLPVADIGTDHGRLPTALVLDGVVPSAIACDRGALPLARARLTITAAGAEDRVQLRQGEGLAPLRPGEAATAVIAGMGGPTMLAILAADGERTRALRRVVLQANFGVEAVRHGLAGLGLALIDERLVSERGRFYAILVAEPGVGEALDELAGLVGPYLLARGGPLLTQHLERELRRCELEAAGLASATRAVERGRGAALSRRAELLARALAAARGLVKPGAAGHPGPA